MRHFKFINDINSTFYKPPTYFNLSSNKEILSHALGATLYMSAARKTLMEDILKTNSCSIVICLEDSVATSMLPEAEKNVLSFFNHIEKEYQLDKHSLDKLPLIFMRVRNFYQYSKLLENSNFIGLCGFIFPKFRAVDGMLYLSTLKSYNIKNNKSLYALPILETKEIIYKETRMEELLKISTLLDSYKELILNIRIGGTDLSGIYALRRSRNFTIYNLNVINDCITDIINIFQRRGYVISAPVCEYFEFHEELDNTCLVREVLLDKVNGLVGKTVIHPLQVDIVNSLMAVSKEDYLDAETILNASTDGVLRSTYKNKMNEVKPHFKWAYKTMLLSKIMGVLNDGKCYKDIINLSNKNLYRSKFGNFIKYQQNKI